MYNTIYTKKILNTVIFFLSILLVCFLLYSGFNTGINVLQQRIFFVFNILLLWIVYKIQDHSKENIKHKLYFYLYFLFFIAICILLAYYTVNSQSDILLEKSIFGIDLFDVYATWVLIFFILICTTQKIGIALSALSSLFLLYAFFGSYLDGMWGHRGYTFSYIASYLGWTLEGIFSSPVAAVVNFVGLYVLFGELLDVFGAGKFFIDISYAFTGKMKGGPAQAAIFSSALMGSINGSAVANVVTTGTFTIPLMRKVGYTASSAAAIEAVASTGGQIMPPVMGAAAFVMADMTGIAYSTILLAALIPALLYYTSLSFCVYLRAAASDLHTTQEKLPQIKNVLRKDFPLLLPLFLLLYLLLGKGYSANYAVLFAMALLLFIGTIRIVRREKRLPVNELVLAIKGTAKTLIFVSVACMAAGIVIGIVNMTGIGVQFTQLVFTTAGDNFFLMLCMVMVACLILGMGLPSTAAYCIVALVSAPALMKFGVDILSAHIFVFYFAIISFITPPIGLAAYSASGIAQSPPLRTAWEAFLLGIAGFIIPFLIIYRPALLMQNTLWWESLYATVVSVLALFLLALSFEGWFLKHLNLITRISLFVLAFLMLKPSVSSDIFSLLMSFLLLTLLYLKNKPNKKQAQSSLH